MDETLLKRVMPHSAEAEQSVIGAMLMDRDAITIASEILTTEDFYQKQYGILFEAMVELYTENSPVDVGNVKSLRCFLRSTKTHITAGNDVKSAADAVNCGQMC